MTVANREKVAVPEREQMRNCNVGILVSFSWVVWVHACLCGKGELRHYVHDLVWNFFGHIRGLLVVMLLLVLVLAIRFLVAVSARFLSFVSLDPVVLVVSVDVGEVVALSL